MLYHILAELVAWAFPKVDRQKFRRFCKEIDKRRKGEKKIFMAQKQNAALLPVLQKEYTKRKLKVCFLCQDNAKWSYQSLYEAFDKSEHFEPQVLVSITTDLLEKNCSFSDYKKKLRDNYDFFASRGMNVAYAFNAETKKFIDLKEFRPDIIFYEGPWGLKNMHAPYKTARYALSCHCSYGASIVKATYEFTVPFYRQLWRYFLDNGIEKHLYLSQGFEDENVPVCGLLKLDVYAQPIKHNLWKTEGKKRIIWAPHHSFADDSLLRCGTFDWNYKFMYEYAKSHPEYEFILKPHPVLFKAIVNSGLMTPEEIDEYFAAWRELPNAQVVEGGDYFDLFKTSDIMITDCCSFLCEYLLTEKPLVHLINPKSVGYNEFGQRIIAGYYPVYDVQELEAKMDDILIKGKDELKTKRQEIIKEFRLGTESVAKNIIEHLENCLKGENK